jgi:DNA-binding Lrp family transcriptional regulator
MTHVDTELLPILIENSRHSNADLARMLNRSEAAISESIQRMLDQGIIRRFSVVIDEDLIDGTPVKALVELSIRPEKDTGYDAIAQTIHRYPNVVSHYLVSGKYDFLVVVSGKDHRDIAHFVFDKLATIENVVSTTTHFIFKAYKEHGVVMGKPDVADRVPLIP